ncbi:MAG: hypothetical protein M3137_08250 [Actinomycetota bacterium]|nr:hypothetical protein [Actinomycetota bacterium]
MAAVFSTRPAPLLTTPAALRVADAVFLSAALVVPRACFVADFPAFVDFVADLEAPDLAAPDVFLPAGDRDGLAFLAADLVALPDLLVAELVEAPAFLEADAPEVADFLAVDFLAVDFCAVDFLAVDFCAVGLLAVDFCAVGLLAVDVADDAVLLADDVAATVDFRPGVAALLALDLPATAALLAACTVAPRAPAAERCADVDVASADRLTAPARLAVVLALDSQASATSAATPAPTSSTFRVTALTAATAVFFTLALA